MKTTFLCVCICLCLLIGLTCQSFSGLMEESSTFRCERGLVSLNDSFHEVKEKCGEPQSFSPGIWVYDFGTHSFIYMIKFNGGRVYKIINTGNYGNYKKPE